MLNHSQRLWRRTSAVCHLICLLHICRKFLQSRENKTSYQRKFREQFYSGVRETAEDSSLFRRVKSPVYKQDYNGSVKSIQRT